VKSRGFKSAWEIKKSVNIFRNARTVKWSKVVFFPSRILGFIFVRAPINKPILLLLIGKSTQQQHPGHQGLGIFFMHQHGFQLAV